MKIADKLGIVGSIFSLAGLGLVIASSVAEAAHKEGRKAQAEAEAQAQAQEVKRAFERGIREGQAPRNRKPSAPPSCPRF